MKLSLYTMVLLCFFAHNGAAQGLKSIETSDIFESAGTIIRGIVQELIERIRSPKDVFGASKQILVGLPETALFQTIGKLCSIYIAAETIVPRITPDMELITLKLHTPNEELSFSLKDAEKILKCPEFDVNKRVIILSPGWNPSIAAGYVADMANAYNRRGNYNFLSLNTSDSVDTLYTWSAFNTEALGRALAAGIEQLAKQVPVSNIHLIGQSLGAHIVGYAGRYFTEKTGFLLPRITGLDPANPCFSEGSNLSGLQRGDALFVDVIHSNFGSLGVSQSIGDADFYPGGMAPIMPGCTKFPCSHMRSYEYFIESVYPGNENNFLGVRCTSLKHVKDGTCKGKKYPMGYAVPHNLKGNYYLPVNGKKPFGQNSRNLEAAASDDKKY